MTNSAPQEQPLDGRTAIVAGASNGIGHAISEHLAQTGAYLFLAGRTKNAMDQTKNRIEETCGEATVFTADQRDASQV